jgi:hypothetical protein
MSKFSLALLGLSTLSTGCDLFGPSMTGTWDVEVVDADDCTVELELEQHGDEISGEADLFCRVYFSYYGETFYYDYDEGHVDVEGDIDGDEFELILEFWDDVFEYDAEVVLTGTLDGDEIEGEVELDGDEFGDFEGDR